MIDAIIDDSYIIAGKLNRGLIISKELSYTHTTYTQLHTLLHSCVALL